MLKHGKWFYYEIDKPVRSVYMYIIETDQVGSFYWVNTLTIRGEEVIYRKRHALTMTRELTPIKFSDIPKAYRDHMPPIDVAQYRMKDET